MTATILLVRHASHDRLGRVLCGRMAGVTLSAAGQREAEGLAAAIRRGGPVDAIYASPLERAGETAEPISRVSGVPVVIEADLDEVDFGSWSGADFDDLAGDERWQYWNRERDQGRPPGGETMAEAQCRVVRVLDRLREADGDRTIVLVSHADLIKTGLAWALGLPLAFYARFEISPASVSRLIVAPGHVKVWSINETLAA